MGNILQNSAPVIFNRVTIVGVKERITEGKGRTWQVNAVCDSELNSFALMEDIGGAPS